MLSNETLWASEHIANILQQKNDKELLKETINPGVKGMYF